MKFLIKLLQSCEIILKRFKPINNSDDFLNNDIGLEKLDSICMQLIAIGESLKNFKRDFVILLILSTIFLNEAFTLKKILGVLVISAGIFIISY